MEKESIYIVMPAYNEEDSIENVVRQWYPILNNGNHKSRMVIADFGSTDGTHEKLLELKKEFQLLEVVENSNKQHGPKCFYLYNYAIEKGADWIFQTDSDGQTNPEEFKEFWDQRNNFDVIIGKRMVRGDGKSRAFVEKVVCLLLKIYFKVSVPDANAPFRLMKSNVLKKYISKISEDYNLPNIMLTTYFSRYNEKLLFKEISFKPRTTGKNSINIPKIVKIGWKALGDFNKFKKGMKEADASRK